MKIIEPISSQTLLNRRKQLKNQRRFKAGLTLLRTLILIGMVYGSYTLIILPKWLLKDSSQIEIRGNRFLDEEEFRSLIPISYPQSIVKLKPENLKEKLKSNTPVIDARISRHLLPAKLIIEIEERPPVAVITLGNTKVSQNSPQNRGYIDEKGNIIPFDFYKNPQEKEFKLPELYANGYLEQYKSDWQQLYQEITKSSLKIFAVDWRNPSDLILKTELGKVNFGPLTSQFSYQLTVLEKMRDLPNKLQIDKIEYIDLTIPTSPKVKLKEEIK